MSTLYIDRKGLGCKLENGALVFYENGERCGTVPTAPLERIVFKSDVSINTGALAKLAARGIGMLFLSGHAIKPTLFLPTEHKDAERRRSQYQLSEDPEFCRLFAVDLLTEKLQAQKRHVVDLSMENHDEKAFLESSITRLDELLGRLNAEPSLDALRGLEGLAAAVYFEALGRCVSPELGFTHRNRRPPRDPVNALLSLTYTLLTSEAGVSAHQAGLDPFVGFLHSLEYGRPSLACDLMEPLRPEADRFVLSLFQTKTITLSDFTKTTERCQLSKDGRIKFYPQYEAVAGEWRRYLNKRSLKHASTFVTQHRSHKQSQ